MYLAVDQFGQNGFLGLRFEIVHQPDPLHRIAGFHALRHAVLFHQLGNQLLQSPVRRLVDLPQMGVQGLRQDHAVPQYLPVLLQILLPHPSVLAQGLRLGLGKGQVRDQVIPGLRVVQIVLHGTVSFLPVPAGLLRVHSS